MNDKKVYQSALGLSEEEAELLGRCLTEYWRATSPDAALCKESSQAGGFIKSLGAGVQADGEKLFETLCVSGVQFGRPKSDQTNGILGKFDDDKFDTSMCAITAVGLTYEHLVHEVYGIKSKEQEEIQSTTQMSPVEDDELSVGIGLLQALSKALPSLGLSDKNDEIKKLHRIWKSVQNEKHGIASIKTSRLGVRIWENFLEETQSDGIKKVRYKINKKDNAYLIVENFERFKNATQTHVLAPGELIDQLFKYGAISFNDVLLQTKKRVLEHLKTNFPKELITVISGGGQEPAYSVFVAHIKLLCTQYKGAGYQEITNLAELLVAYENDKEVGPLCTRVIDKVFNNPTLNALPVSDELKVLRLVIAEKKELEALINTKSKTIETSSPNAHQEEVSTRKLAL